MPEENKNENLNQNDTVQKELSEMIQDTEKIVDDTFKIRDNLLSDVEKITSDLQEVTSDMMSLLRLVTVIISINIVGLVYILIFINLEGPLTRFILSYICGTLIWLVYYIRPFEQETKTITLQKVSQWFKNKIKTTTGAIVNLLFVLAISHVILSITTYISRYIDWEPLTVLLTFIGNNL